MFRFLPDSIYKFIVLLLPALIGPFLLVHSVQDRLNYNLLSTSSAMTRGTVTEVKQNGIASYPRNMIKYRYDSPEGKHYLNSIAVSADTLKILSVGMPFDIKYLPASPGVSLPILPIADSAEYTSNLIFICLGFVITLCLGWLLYKMIRIILFTKRLLKSGTRVLAQIELLKRDNFWYLPSQETANGRGVRYDLKFTYVDAQSRPHPQVKSIYLRREAGNAWTHKPSLIVYYDKERPESFVYTLTALAP